MYHPNITSSEYTIHSFPMKFDSLSQESDNLSQEFDNRSTKLPAFDRVLLA